ncbi:MAG: 23S rRNA (adenine(2503)-C(2))-methyltransferase RlmN [Candidatus Omnitrophota bacterium]|nr:23S rRNA (adenine(2503)-C(2))-methyltransferase RlmN [Candidatus Omnitrophota bacterium]
MQDIKELTLKELEETLKSFGANAYNARQIFSWIYKKGVSEFAQMSDLSQSLRDSLSKSFYISGLAIVKKLKSSDGTQKLLFKLKDASLIEAVIIPAKGRITGCLSTQVGCKFACRFCASGISGFKRNLTSSEIIEEVLYLKRESLPERLTHLVFMGTGEPLDNYNEIIRAIRIINSPDGCNIGARRITISTSGIIPGIQKLAGEGLQIELSVSLHAAGEKLRTEIMPINEKYPLKELIAACKEYVAKTNRQITFEYILIKGLNAGLKNAQELSKLLSGWKLAKVNLIPSNLISELKAAPPEKKDILAFRDYLIKHKVNVTLRKERGEDINAACGQLRLTYAKE